MTDERFAELINLYLDNEIGRSELGELKHAISGNLVMRRKFERACQLHQAARKALSNQAENQAREESSESRRPHGEHSGERPSERSREHDSSGRNEWKHRQSQAHRNATVGARADRQLNIGAASRVDLSKVSLEDDDDRVGQLGEGDKSEKSAALSFFGSTHGMIIGAAMVVAITAGLFYAIDQADTSSAARDPDPDSVPEFVGDPGQVKNEMQGLNSGPISAGEIMPSQLALPASGGDAFARSVQVDYESTQQGGTPGNVANGNQASSWYVHVQSSTFVGSGNLGVMDMPSAMGPVNITVNQTAPPAPVPQLP